MKITEEKALELLDNISDENIIFLSSCTVDVEEHDNCLFNIASPLIFAII